MKKKLTFVALLILIVVTITALTACGELESLEIGSLPETYDGMDKANGESAFALFNEAYNNFLDESVYNRVQYYDFATISGAKQSMQIKTTRKINGEQIYNQEVVLAAGVMSLNEGKKVYFDKDSSYSLYFNDKKRVAGTGEDVFAVTEWDKFGDYDTERYGDVESTKLSYKNQLCFYNVKSKEYLAKDSDDTVYTKENKYYFTLIIDCSDSAMSGAQQDVAEAIAKKTASSPKDLKMKSNTKIRAEVRKIDGKYKFTLLQIDEEYNGKLSLFKAECKTKYYNEFYYGNDAGAITDTDLYGIVL